ncbi:MAG: ThiF family adenylyltransferase [Gammaproteobacteria bacterium]|nr:ThiF family adenylyltransferase [Gammaproteobacteria bacterium]
MNSWRLTLPERLYQSLSEHLFRGDDEEHGAVILAGTCQSDRGLRLVARELHLAVDGTDYIRNERGYYTLQPHFITEKILRAQRLKLAYLTVHNHMGIDSVEFSHIDLRSHERGYPALLDINEDRPVGALVFAKEAIAGDLWLRGRKRSQLNHAIVVGKKRKVLSPFPRCLILRHNELYARQTLLFGEVGQDILGKIRVGIVGLGGVGSIVAELLGRLGVGEFVLADPDRAEKSNLSRLIGARKIHAFGTTSSTRYGSNWFGTTKVKLAARNIRKAGKKNVRITMLPYDFLHDDVAAQFKDCDYIFLAADDMKARTLFNVMVHQYGIPGVQIGVKVRTSDSGEVGDVYCVNRFITPDNGCMWCRSLIKPQRGQQNNGYVDDPDVASPSVITLNAIAGSHAANDFLFYTTGLKQVAQDYVEFRWHPRAYNLYLSRCKKDNKCIDCSLNDKSCLGRGDDYDLPTKPTRTL